VLTALLAISGNGSDQLLSLRMARGQAGSMAELARLAGEELARSVLASGSWQDKFIRVGCVKVLEAKCGDIARLLTDIFNSRTGFCTA